MTSISFTHDIYFQRQSTHDDFDTKNEQSDDESSNNIDVPTDFQLSDTLLGQYKHMVNNQVLLVEEECIIMKDELSELNKVFNFPSNFQVNVAPIGRLECISVSSNVKNNDTNLLMVEKRINDSLKLMLNMVSYDSSNVDVELISYLAQSAIVLAVNDLLLVFANEQVLPNHYSKRVFYSNVFTVPKPGTTLHLLKSTTNHSRSNIESTIDGETFSQHSKTRNQEILPPCVSRSTIQRLIPLHYRCKK
ncbi:hypothetical protein ACTFIW_003635 [Dictyostelium discoideum]